MTQELVRASKEFDRDKVSTHRACMAVLIEHLDGKAVTFTLSFYGRHSSYIKTARLLISRKCLEEQGTDTVITDKGRKVLCKYLGEYADTLLMAHLKQIDNDVLLAKLSAAHYPPAYDTVSESGLAAPLTVAA